MKFSILRTVSLLVIPAKAGIQLNARLDSRVRGNDRPLAAQSSASPLVTASDIPAPAGR